MIVLVRSIDRCQFFYPFSRNWRIDFEINKMSAFEENALSEVEQNINARTPLSSTPLDTSAKQKQQIEIDSEDLRLAKLLQAQELAYASFLGQPEDMPDADNDNWMYGLTDDEIAARLQAQEDEWASPFL